jgi:hypothetical protein
MRLCVYPGMQVSMLNINYGGDFYRTPQRVLFCLMPPRNSSPDSLLGKLRFSASPRLGFCDPVNLSVDVRSQTKSSAHHKLS